MYRDGGETTKIFARIPRQLGAERNGKIPGRNSAALIINSGSREIRKTRARAQSLEKERYSRLSLRDLVVFTPIRLKDVPRKILCYTNTTDTLFLVSTTLP